MTWGISKEGGTQCKYVKKAKQNKKKLLAFHAVNFKAREPIILIELQYGIVILILNTVNSIAWFSWGYMLLFPPFLSIIASGVKRKLFPMKNERKNQKGHWYNVSILNVDDDGLESCLAFVPDLHTPARSMFIKSLVHVWDVIFLPTNILVEEQPLITSAIYLTRRKPLHFYPLRPLDDFDANARLLEKMQNGQHEHH